MEPDEPAVEAVTRRERFTVPVTAFISLVTPAEPTAVNEIRSAQVESFALCWTLIVVFPLTVLVGTCRVAAPPLADEAALSTELNAPNEPWAMLAPAVS